VRRRDGPADLRPQVIAADFRPRMIAAAAAAATLPLNDAARALGCHCTLSPVSEHAYEQRTCFSPALPSSPTHTHKPSLFSTRTRTHALPLHPFPAPGPLCSTLVPLCSFSTFFRLLAEHARVSLGSFPLFDPSFQRAPPTPRSPTRPRRGPSDLATCPAPFLLCFQRFTPWGVLRRGVARPHTHTHHTRLN
jgi:hypothetical protein